MIKPLTHIATLSVEKFMTEYWHLKPYLFRQAFPDFEPLCDFDTIADMIRLFGREVIPAFTAN